MSQQLSSWVASLEQKLLAPKPMPPAAPVPVPVPAEAAPPAAVLEQRRNALTPADPYGEPKEAINALLARLTALDAAAEAMRPQTAPVRYNVAPASQKDDDTVSEASWSADAFGKSKTPGWYHTSRKQLYQHRSKLASTAPKGVYTSHTKYADEAVRIKNTGRLAF